jgi:hypothetical protein
LVAVLFENVRHPGAGRFIRSSAVGDDCAVTWDVCEVLLDKVGWNADRARQFGLSFSPCCRVACVNEKYVFSAVQTGAQVLYANPIRHSPTALIAGEGYQWIGTEV